MNSNIKMTYRHSFSSNCYLHLCANSFLFIFLLLLTIHLHFLRVLWPVNLLCSSDFLDSLGFSDLLILVNRDYHLNARNRDVEIFLLFLVGPISNFRCGALEAEVFTVLLNLAFVLLEDLSLRLSSTRVLDNFRLTLISSAWLRLIRATCFPSSLFLIDFLDATEKLHLYVRETFNFGRFHCGAVDNVPSLKKTVVLIG